MPSAVANNPEIADRVCGASEYCAYQFDGRSGLDADFNACEPDWYCGIYDLSHWDYYHTNTTIDNRTSSIWNRGTTYAYSVWTQFKGGGGQMICFPTGTYINQATLSALDMNNRTTSMWTSPTNDCAL